MERNMCVEIEKASGISSNNNKQQNVKFARANSLQFPIQSLELQLFLPYKVNIFDCINGVVWAAF